ncbi:hypothetical protein C8R43DRAFT_1139417 [Mycena crocata]|nr:hypothetical protein C8R43DRAFT_1139417 [Mycena crocata]
MADTDSDMDTPFRDTDHYIEDRKFRGQFHARTTVGFWTGSQRTPTWVYPLGSRTDVPPPPFTGLLEQGGSTATRTPGASGSGENAAGMLRNLATNDAATGSSRTADTRSQAESTDARHWESPRHQEEVLRHAAMTSRERYRDEPYWRHNRNPRYDERQPRDYDDRDVLDRDRFVEKERLWEDRERARDREDRYRASEARSQRARTGAANSRRADIRHEIPPRLFPSPDPYQAPRGSDGHPQSEKSIARAAAADEDGDNDADVGGDPDYVTKELERLERVRTKDRSRAVGQVPPPRDSRLGIWKHLQISNIAQAINLGDWIYAGEDTAYEMFSFIAGQASAVPADFRTEGETYIMRHQQRLERDWWTTTRGAPRPSRADRNRKIPATGMTRNAAATTSRNGVAGSSRQTPLDADAVMVDAGAPATGGGRNTQDASPAFSFGMTLSIPPLPSTTRSVHALAPPYVMTDGHGYLGTSPPNEMDLTPTEPAVGEWRAWNGLPNTQGTDREVIHHYVLVRTGQWPLGARNILGARPREGDDSIHIGDALVVQTVHALGPDGRRGHQYHVFFENWVMMMSIPGLYAHIVNVGGYPFAELPMEHYPGPTNNVTMPDVAAWMVQHGIAPTSNAVLYMEEFARARRNMRANIENLNAVGWPEEPRNVASAMAADPNSIPSWVEMLRSRGVAAAMLAAPAPPAGISASMHAPEMEVDSTDTARSIPSPPPETPPVGDSAG